MKIPEIAKLPTVVNNIHESVFRADAILDKVEELLDLKVNHEVIFQIVQELRNAPNVSVETPIKE